jgi:hypothetical protein
MILKMIQNYIVYYIDRLIEKQIKLKNYIINRNEDKNKIIYITNIEEHFACINQ